MKAKEMLTIEEAKRRVQEIADMDHHDGEQPHQAEDELYLDVLETIAQMDDAPKAKELATIALQVRTMSFPRWYA